MAYSVSPRRTVCSPLVDGAICGVAGRAVAVLVRAGLRSLTGAEPFELQATSLSASTPSPMHFTAAPAAVLISQPRQLHRSRYPR